MREKSKTTAGELCREFLGLSLERFATTTRADFRFAPINAFLLVMIFVIGLVVHLVLYPYRVEAVALSLGSALVLAILVRLTQVWEAVVVLGGGAQRQGLVAAGDLRQTPIEVDGRRAPHRQQGAGPGGVEEEGVVGVAELGIGSERGEVRHQVDPKSHRQRSLSRHAADTPPDIDPWRTPVAERRLRACPARRPALLGQPPLAPDR